MIAYKLVRLKKDGNIGSLFINRQFNIIMDEWLVSENIPTKGFANRQGWHCTLTKNAPHLKMNLSNGEVRVWAKVEVEEYELYNRPESQGGTWVLANKIKFLEICQ